MISRCEVCGGVCGELLPVAGAGSGVEGDGSGAADGVGDTSGTGAGPGATIDRPPACAAGSGTGRVGRR